MFTEIPASKTSISGRKLILGVAINDADYMVSIKVDGKLVQCPYYSRWSNMLKRCYCKKTQQRNPSYSGCTASNEWLTFSNFKKWMQSQNWEGNHLDKDILVYGNKHYSKETCIFVTLEINSLMLDHRSARGSYPQGVCLSQGKYQSYCNKYGKRVCLGTYKTPEEASVAYKDFKYNLIISTANNQHNKILKKALFNNAKAFKNGY